MKKHKHTKQQALKIVVECAKKYSEELLDRYLMLICVDKHCRVFCYELAFHDQHFLHLTGLKLPGRSGDNPNNYIGAKDFFARCIEQKLSINDFELSKDETTDKKLDVLPEIICKNLRIRSIGDYNGSKPKLYTEKLAGGVKACIGFVTSKSNELVPNTLLQEDIRTVTGTTQRVIAILRKKRTDLEYAECVYIAKEVDLSSYIFPEEYVSFKDILFSMLSTKVL